MVEYGPLLSVCVVRASYSDILREGDRINTYTEWVLIVRRERGGHRCSFEQVKTAVTMVVLVTYTSLNLTGILMNDMISHVFQWR